MTIAVIQQFPIPFLEADATQAKWWRAVGLVENGRGLKDKPYNAGELNRAGVLNEGLGIR